MNWISRRIVQEETKDQPAMSKYLLLFRWEVEHFLPIYLTFHDRFESLHKRKKDMSNLVQNWIMWNKQDNLCFKIFANREVHIHVLETRRTLEHLQYKNHKICWKSVVIPFGGRIIVDRAKWLINALARSLLLRK